MNDTAAMTEKLQTASFQRFSEGFFARDAVVVAPKLIGAFIVRSEPGWKFPLVARIIETEAYRGDDPACHAYHLWRSGREPSGRAAALYTKSGVAYVYLNYGVHWLLNVVTDKPGVASAVLIRGVEPIQGVEFMQNRRKNCSRVQNLGIGPGNVTKILDIDQNFHGLNLISGDRLFFAKASPRSVASIKIAATSRIGISKGLDLPWRFVDAAHYPQ